MSQTDAPTPADRSHAAASTGSTSEPPWRPGAATGVGSMPGDDVVAAARLVLDEVPDLPYLPELPARGPWGAMVGRAAAVLVDLPVTLEPSGWRLASRPSVDGRRAATMLASDLDLFAALTSGDAGPVKVQVTGPWTLASSVETPRGGVLLADPGALRDLVDSLAEGVAAHVEDVRRRLPEARLVVQVDEPGLPAAMSGSVATVSGLGRLPAVPAPEATAALSRVVAAVSAPVVVHCCAPGAPVGIVRGSGADALSVDLDVLPASDDDSVAEAVEAGMAVLVGVVPATDVQMSDLAATVRRVRGWWGRLGFESKTVGDTVVPTPSCGLAGATPPYAQVALRRCREVARVLVDGPEET